MPFKNLAKFSSSLEVGDILFEEVLFRYYL